jgi:hypothetical protein
LTPPHPTRPVGFGTEIVFLICRKLGIKATNLNDTATKSDDAQFAKTSSLSSPSSPPNFSAPAVIGTAAQPKLRLNFA